jgi:hypothetical protein
VESSKDLSTTGQLLTITADDLDVNGGVSTGSAVIEVRTESNDRQISLGSIAAGLHMSDAELGRFTTDVGVFIGDARAGNIVVSSITDSNSDMISLLTLVAQKVDRTVEFASSSSFNKGITVDASAGIIFNGSVTTKNSETILIAGSGTITVAAATSLSTSDQLLTLTSDDVDFAADATVSAGTATIILTTLSQQTIGVGAYQTQYDLESPEFATLDSNGLVIGKDDLNRMINVVGITDSASESVAGLVTMLSTVDDQRIIFNATSSVFHGLNAQADNGVVVDADITTTQGDMYLDADFDDSSTSDSMNSIEFSSGKSLTAKAFMTLEATTGHVVRNGELTLAAGRGIVLSDGIQGGVEQEPLVIHAGYDVLTDGTLTLAAGKEISTESSVFITAMDVNIQGGIQTYNSSLAIHTSGVGRTIGIGVSAKDLHLDATEVQRLTTSGLSIGGMSSGSVTVGGVSEFQSSSVGGIVTIAATSDDAQVSFSAQEAAFGAVAAQADNGIFLDSDMVTQSGNLTLDADIDHSATDDPNNSITISGERLLQSSHVLTLDSTSAGIQRSGTGTVKIIGGEGVILNVNINSTTPGQPLEIQADNNADGVGILTIRPGKTVDSADGPIIITAADIDIGNIVSGAAATTISTSKPTLTIGVGLTSKDLTLTGTELRSITATGLTIGSNLNSDVTVDGVEAADTTSITDVVTLMAMDPTKTITFSNSPSTFNAMAALSGNGVSVSTTVTTIVGDLVIDGDADDTKTGSFGDKVTIASDTTLTAYQTLILDSMSGGITHVGALTLNAREGVVLNDDMSGQQIERALQINADVDSNGIGSFTVKAGISVNSEHSMIRITAADIDVLGSLSSGTQGIHMHASGVDRTIGLGATAQDMHLADAELAILIVQN